MAIERASEERYEYHDGEIRLMASESDTHGDITVSLTVEFANQLKGKIVVCELKMQK